MVNAQSLLENTEYNIGEIAEIVGYDNPLYFSRVFKKEYGVSPAQYRKNLEGSTEKWEEFLNHPILPELREKAYQYNLPIRIGRNCWLGAGVIVVPGVTIGDDTVIGAGSVVTKDIPANVVAVGNPCRVLRPISEHDKEYFYRDWKINWDAL